MSTNKLDSKRLSKIAPTRIEVKKRYEPSWQDIKDNLARTKESKKPQPNRNNAPFPAKLKSQVRKNESSSPAKKNVTFSPTKKNVSFSPTKKNVNNSPTKKKNKGVLNKKTIGGESPGNGLKGFKIQVDSPDFDERPMLTLSIADIILNKDKQRRDDEVKEVMDKVEQERKKIEQAEKYRKESMIMMETERTGKPPIYKRKLSQVLEEREKKAQA